MKKNRSSKSGFITTRNLIGLLLGTAAMSLAMISFAAGPSNQLKINKQPVARGQRPGIKPNVAPVPSAPTPATGTLRSTNIGSANELSWNDSVGSVANLTFFAGNGTCAVPNSCSTFTLTIDPSVATASGGYDPTKYNIFIEISWAQAQIDYDTWMCSGAGNCTQANVIASNASVSDPEVITLPTTTAAGVYTINAVNATGAPVPVGGVVYLQLIPGQTNCTGNCTPPRYQNYPAGTGQADDAGEPSIGVDWNPNVASLKDISSSDFTTGTTRKNTGGVAFFKSGGHNWRVNFDDCPSPAVNKWDDVSATFDQQFVLTDPIGFVDHYTSTQLGLAYPEPHTPGRVFTIDLVGGQGNSLGASSDDDGNNYTPGGNGGPGQGPDHETLGGGPYNPNSVPPPPPQPVAYPASGTPNAIYYCSQNIVAEAQCSRSDDGGVTFGPGVIIYNPATCTGGIHGHVKVAPDGTVYVPNSSCGTGVAMSTDNGLTWTQENVPGANSSQDPSVGIGQNNVGRPSQPSNTIYLGYVDGGPAKIAHSGDRGQTWSTPVDVGAIFGVTHAVFPVVVAGDDNRAAFGFLGTGPGLATNPPATCDPYGATLNCANIWHLYIATTYDGGNSWITIDATPNDPVQMGTICLQGTTCAGGRNLLDFNDFGIDAEGRGLLGYADGCVNCANAFGGQSSASHGTVARQSGGRRLFAAFDPVEPAPPAAPQMVSATSVTGGTLVEWLEPDNGGSPITGYDVWRGTTSGGETFLAHVSGETTTSYLDTHPPTGNAFYYATAVNGPVPNTTYTGGTGTHCGELPLCLTGCTVNTGNACTFPYVLVDGPGSAGTVSTDPTMGELTIGKVDMGEPFVSCTDNSMHILMKVNTLDPSGTGNTVLPANSAWQVLFAVNGTDNSQHTIYVELDTFSPDTPATPAVSIGRRDPCSAGCGTLDSGICTQSATSSCSMISAVTTKDGYIDFTLNLTNPIPFPAPGAPGVGSAFTWDGRAPGTVLGTSSQKVTGTTYFFLGVGAGFLETVQVTTGGSYTRIGNGSCNSAIPIAVLSGSPLSGHAPLTVNFDGTASREPVGACGVINSYTMNFGDGTTPVTNSTGLFSHAYNNPGDYPARLTVSDTVGKTSTNEAAVTVSVTSSVPNLVSVVSRMQHGSITPPFEVNLPLIGTRGVECRSSASMGAGNYQMVFKFDGPLTSVTGASVTGTGSVSSRQINPLNNQEYVVNLTGVTNAQYISVTLTGVNGTATVPGPQMGVLIGDVTGSNGPNGLVDGNDVSATQSQTRQPVTGSNFRADVNANGIIDGNDVSTTQGHTRTSLPTPP